jgi:glycerophosphoryl diester phosphodiesterase
VFADRTHGPEAFAAQVLAAIAAADLKARVDVQSFDLRTLLQVQDTAPAVRTVVLLADFPRELGGDGANLQGEGDAASPWLAGLPWPYRVTTSTYPARVAPSGGLEGMALRTAPPALLPMLEKPLQGAATGELEIREFDLTTERFTDRRWTYTLDPRATAIGEFTLDASGRGLVIERDDSEGVLTGHKAIVRFELGPPGPVTGKRSLIDLLAILDPHGLAPAQTGDVGLGDGRLALPFFTIESLCALPGERLMVGNDNNLPFGVGRHAGSQAADDSELVVITLPR